MRGQSKRKAFFLKIQSSQTPSLKRSVKIFLSVGFCGLAIFVSTSFLEAQASGKPIPFYFKQEAKAALNPVQLNQIVETLVFQKTNQARQGKSLAILSEDKNLKKAATLHSEDMLRRGYLSHISPEGKTPVDRVKKISPIFYRSLGENLHIIKSSDELRDPEAIANLMIQDWLQSKVHRKNLLGKNFTLLGLGCANDGQTIYCTQVFGKK